MIEAPRILFNMLSCYVTADSVYYTITPKSDKDGDGITVFL